jgi:3-dehydroquinate synthase
MEKLEVNLDNGISYPIHIGSIPNIKLDGKVAIITNPKVSGLHLATLLSKLTAKEVFIISMSDGEEYKNFSTFENILNNLFNHKLDRKSTIIAFGGGVIGDMSGFVAGVYQRGIEFIGIPTTLLSQVDASVGGKTGINNSYGKNLVGLFHQPKAVYIDPDFLDTLASREYSAGIAEIIKMAIAFDLEFFDWLTHNPLNKDNVVYAIKKAVNLKIKVVQNDEKEKGERAKLNYGHTFCHVIEAKTKYKKYLHGEAVAIGMVMANVLAKDIGFITNDEFNKILHLIKINNLPTRYEIDSIDDFYDAFFLDKKSSSGNITFILPNKIGDSVIKSDINEEQIKNSLKRYLALK